MRDTKGITLVALIITIIVLLILAGVSIAILTGENGILSKAKTVEKETEIAEAKEQAKLDIAEWTADQLEKGKSANITDNVIQEILTEQEYVGSVTTDKFTTKKNGYEILYTDLYNAFTGSSEVEESAIPGVIVTGKNKTYTKNGTAVIPVGFSIVEGLDDVSQGLVITDIVGNEFVWIPVTSESEYVRNKTYKEEYISEKAINDTNYLPTGVAIPEGKTEGEVEKEMVVKAGGFYIGRYEAGKEGTDTLVCKKGATVWNNIAQVEAKEKAKMFINNTHVKSGLITGIQWDVTMKFINGKLDGKGNTYNVEIYSSSRHTGSLLTAGQNEADKVCNIYDLEGNGCEYIAEKNTYDTNLPFVNRGGYCSTIHTTPTSRRGQSNGNAVSGDVYRYVLYVQNYKKYTNTKEL